MYTRLACMHTYSDISSPHVALVLVVCKCCLYMDRWSCTRTSPSVIVLHTTYVWSNIPISMFSIVKRPPFVFSPFLNLPHLHFQFTIHSHIPHQQCLPSSNAPINCPTSMLCNIMYICHSSSTCVCMYVCIYFM